MTTAAAEPEFPEQVQAVLTEFLDNRVASLEAIDPRCAAMARRLRAFVLDGGKRMRPRFAHAAYLACAPTAAPAATTAEHAVRAMAALELIQACALVHDDIVDDSATRRGTPTVHVQFAAEHRDHDWTGTAADYGRAQAILIGDLALAWADELFSEALLSDPDIATETLRAAHAVWAQMKTEVLGGQMLDILAEAEAAADLETPQRVNRFKTAAYTIERPVQLGAVLAGADELCIAGLREFGVDTGIAYQLVDDLLGVFGDPQVTGKPSGDDLREGKRTLLLNYALATAAPLHAEELHGLLGRELDDAELARAREILEVSGAVDHVRGEADRLITAAYDTLSRLPLGSDGAAQLRALADRVVNRSS